MIIVRHPSIASIIFDSVEGALRTEFLELGVQVVVNELFDAVRSLRRNGATAVNVRGKIERDKKDADARTAC